MVKISTTITKKYFYMKLDDLVEHGYFYEYKEDKTHWSTRLNKIKVSPSGEPIENTEIVFLVGKTPHRFKVVEIIYTSVIPEKYAAAINTEYAYAIKCISVPYEGPDVKYMRWLETLEGHRASDKHENKCLQCGFCCATRPCIPTPEELQNIADYLKLDVKEAVKKYFIGDQIGGTSINIIFPAKKTQTDVTGTFIDAIRTYDIGYCVFFDESRKECQINPVKPKSAKLIYCWKEDEIEPESILELWKNVDIESFGVAPE